jgi:hypothetical protein
VMKRVGARCGWLAGNDQFRRLSRARSNGALKIVLSNNVGEPSQQNKLFFAPPMRAKKPQATKGALSDAPLAPAPSGE